jgi:hypothetical protein
VKIMRAASVLVDGLIASQGSAKPSDPPKVTRAKKVVGGSTAFTVAVDANKENAANGQVDTAVHGVHNGRVPRPGLHCENQVLREIPSEKGTGVTQRGTGQRDYLRLLDTGESALEKLHAGRAAAVKPTEMERAAVEVKVKVKAEKPAAEFKANAEAERRSKADADVKAVEAKAEAARAAAAAEAEAEAARKAVEAHVAAEAEAVAEATRVQEAAKAKEEATMAEAKVAEEKAAAEAKTAEEKAAAESKTLEEKAAAEAKDVEEAEDAAVAEAKAAEEAAGAEVKAKAGTEAAEAADAAAQAETEAGAAAATVAAVAKAATEAKAAVGAEAAEEARVAAAVAEAESKADGGEALPDSPCVPLPSVRDTVVGVEPGPAQVGGGAVEQTEGMDGLQNWDKPNYQYEYALFQQLGALEQGKTVATGTMFATGLHFARSKSIGHGGFGSVSEHSHGTGLLLAIC